MVDLRSDWDIPNIVVGDLSKFDPKEHFSWSVKYLLREKDEFVYFPMTENLQDVPFKNSKYNPVSYVIYDNENNFNWYIVWVEDYDKNELTQLSKHCPCTQCTSWNPLHYFNDGKCYGCLKSVQPNHKYVELARKKSSSF